MNKAIVRMLATAREPLTTDTQIVASMLQRDDGRSQLEDTESGTPEKQLDALPSGLIFVACA